MRALRMNLMMVHIEYVRIALQRQRRHDMMKSMQRMSLTMRDIRMTLETLLTTQNSNICKNNMLINLTKKEITILSNFLEKFKDIQHDSQDELNEINQKLRNLDKCCTCQEDKID